MPFNSKRNGFQNEDDFVNKLNNKMYKELEFYFQLFIDDIFENVSKEDIIICTKDINLKKYDIVINIGNDVKRISIKKGVKNSVHAEPISEFAHFLISNKLPRELVIKFLKYHYADGTTNGKGSVRLSALEYKKSHQDDIDELNLFFNQKFFLRKAIERFIIKGRNSNVGIDAIIYGVPNDFLWIKSEDIYKIILSKNNVYSSSLHFGSLTYQPMDRCINFNPKYEKCRYISQIKWYNISDDIIESMNNNVQ